MIIRSGKDAGAQIVYAAGQFSNNDEYVVSQACGLSPFGDILCCPGSEYAVEVTPDGVSRSWLGKTPLVVSTTISKAWYIKDQESGEVWSAFYNPVCSGVDEYEVRYSPGRVQVYSIQNKIACTLTIAISSEHSCEVWHVKLENLSAQDRTLRFTTYVEPTVDSPLETRYLKQDKVLLMRRPLESMESTRASKSISNIVFFHSCTLPVCTCRIEKSEFIGPERTLCNPIALDIDSNENADGIAVKAVASFGVDIEIPIEGEAEFGFCFGAANTADEAAEAAHSLTKIDAVSNAVKASQEQWSKLTSSVKVQTQDPALNALINTWLPYEAYSAWVKQHAESAALNNCGPANSILRFLPLGANAAYLFREALMNFAGRLSVAGTYHTDEFSQIAMHLDELLWLVICTASYVAETGNVGALSQTAAFKDGLVMSLGEHCERIIRKCASGSPESSQSTEVLEQALRLWAFIKPCDEFMTMLEKITNRKASESNELPEDRTLPRRLRYLRSICPTLAEMNIPSQINGTCDTRTMLAAYYTLMEGVFGIIATNEGLILKPNLPESWFECMIVRRFRGDTYNIHIKRSATQSKKGISMVVDGEPVLGNMLPLFADGCEHRVEITVS